MKILQDMYFTLLSFKLRRQLPFCRTRGDYVQIEKLDDVFCGNQENLTQTTVFNGGEKLISHTVKH